MKEREGKLSREKRRINERVREMKERGFFKSNNRTHVVT